MSSLLHALASVQPTLPIVEPPACPGLRHNYERCYQTHPTDMGRWCEDCLGGADPEGELPDWMGGIVPMPEPDAPGEPRLSMADWIEVQASLVRSNGSNLAEWLAGKMDALAEECRILRAESPDEFEGRAEVMAQTAAAHDEPREERYRYPYGGVS